MTPILIDIGVATYKRPQKLSEVLESLTNLEVKEHVEFRIIIIDNDCEKSAQHMVNEFMRRTAIELVYDVEPIQNIALARNRCLKNRKGNFFAFIDDDEIASPGWLQNLLDCLVKYDAQVVFGPVYPIFGVGTAKIYTDSGLFDHRGPFPTGMIRSNGGTGNVLISDATLKREDFKFNSEYGLTGAEDAELFFRLNKSGIKMIWCNEAIVHEKLDQKRTNIRWAVRRAFRGGQMWARLYVPEMTRTDKLFWLVKRGIFLLAGSLGLLLWAIRPSWGFTAIQKIASNLGQLTGRYKALYYKEYKN